MNWDTVPTQKSRTKFSGWRLGGSRRTSGCTHVYQYRGCFSDSNTRKLLQKRQGWVQIPGFKNILMVNGAHILFDCVIYDRFCFCMSPEAQNNTGSDSNMYNWGFVLLNRLNEKLWLIFCCDFKWWRSCRRLWSCAARSQDPVSCNCHTNIPCLYPLRCSNCLQKSSSRILKKTWCVYLM